MADIVDKQTRSRMMSGIRSRNTRPEMLIRRGLHALGFRFRLHDRTLPGKPDLVFRKHHAVIMVNGCFWHAHNCSLFKLPSTRREWWKQKFARTRQRDREVLRGLEGCGFRVLRIWECSFRGPNSRTVEDVVSFAADWIQSDKPSHEIGSRQSH